MNEPFTIEFSCPYVGKRLGFEGRSVTLLLAAVDRRPRSAMPNADRMPFVLLFEGTRDDVLPAGLYRAAVQDGPEFELYILPIHTMTQDRQDYQAVFN